MLQFIHETKDFVVSLQQKYKYVKKQKAAAYLPLLFYFIIEYSLIINHQMKSVQE